MPKQFRCEYCGFPLIYKSNALKNRGVILDLIHLHECDESYAENITDTDKPQRGSVAEISTEAEQNQEEDNKAGFKDAFDLGDGDKRDKKDLRTSTAPEGVIANLKTLSSSVPENDLDDL